MHIVDNCNILINELNCINMFSSFKSHQHLSDESLNVRLFQEKIRLALKTFVKFIN